MMSKCFGFCVSDVFRERTIMTENDMPQLPGQRSLLQEDREALVVSNDVSFFVSDNLNSSECVLVLLSIN